MKTIIFLTFSFLTLNISSQSKSIESIIALYKEGKYESVIKIGEEAISIYPNNPRLNLILGRSYTDTRKYNKATPYLKRVIKSNDAKQWMLAWSHAYLGVCYYMVDSIDISEKHLTYALKLNATVNANKFAKRSLTLFQMSSYFDNWKIRETQHIRFHIQPGTVPNNLSQYCYSREEAYTDINKFFISEPPKKIDFYVWSKPSEGLENIGRKPGYANPKFCIINSKIDQTKGHEITHVLSEYSPYKPQSKNKFIDEGIAVAFDLTRRDRIALAKSVNKKNLKIKELIQSSGTIDNELIYYVGGAFIDYLRKAYGDEKLKKFMIRQTWQNLIEVYTDSNITAFDNLIQNN